MKNELFDQINILLQNTDSIPVSLPLHLHIDSVHDWRWSSGPRPPEIISDHQNILSSGPVDNQNI